MRHIILSSGLQDLSILQNMGCRVFQSYLFSKPLAIDEFEAFLNESVLAFWCRQMMSQAFILDKTFQHCLMLKLPIFDLRV